MKIKCEQCNKTNKSKICCKYGLHNNVNNQMINNAVKTIDELLKKNNKKNKIL